MKKILIIDDDENILAYLHDALREKGYDVTTASSGEKGLVLFQRQRFFAALTDLRMNDLSGLGVMARMKEIDPDAMLIMMTAFASVETAVEAMKRGAMDYLEKPFDLEDLLEIFERIEASKHILSTTQGKQWPSIEAQEAFICESAAMQAIKAMIHKVAPSDATILILGESGVGKEVVARYTHQCSRRAGYAFVAIDCGAMAENLLESELFGHVKGAFTGAVDHHQGLFEKASGGTIFLDEIGNMALGLQAKLLRVLQERKVKPVGSNTERSIDVRVLAATNKNLRWEVDQGTFRKDLFYRLDVISLYIPPLRDRKDDIRTLCRFYLAHGAGPGQSIREIEPEALTVLQGYAWPGNVRELFSVLEKTRLMMEGDTLCADDLPEHLSQGFLGRDYKGEKDQMIHKFEKSFIEDILKRCDGNITLAAQEMKISRRNLHQKIKELDIKSH